MTQDQLIHTSMEELQRMKHSDERALHSEKITTADVKKLYYDKEQDECWKETYYMGISWNWLRGEALLMKLRQLVINTHQYKYPYHLSKGQFLYTWVDVQPNGKLKGLYSGIEKDPFQAIIEDEKIILKRFSRFQDFLCNDYPPSERKEKMIQISRLYRLNTEHVVPQSWFKAREPMKGDLHHLFACEPECNKARSNFPYYDFALNGEKGEETRCGRRSDRAFEPRYGKGAVARATLYFLLRYHKTISRRFKKNIDLKTLAVWHEKYPVTPYEKHRNKAIFEIQGNRNPFIDYPEESARIISLLLVAS